jgi:5-methylcytosine-specific restriction protein A
MSKYSWMYNNRQWRARRLQQLTDHPLCNRCMDRGQVTAATVAHHVHRHEGNLEVFHTSPLESLCAACHDTDAKEQEAHGYSTAVGTDGWPTDPAHPTNRRMR